MSYFTVRETRRWTCSTASIVCIGYCGKRAIRCRRHVLQERLECSRATIIRVIRDMRDCLGAPIEYDRDASGYHYNRADGQPYELPGLWFNPSELHSLLAVQRLLAELQPGLLESHIAPLRERIERILKVRGDFPGRHQQPHPHSEHGFPPRRSRALPHCGGRRASPQTPEHHLPWPCRQ